MKKNILSALLIAIMVFSSVPFAFAECKGGHCSLKGKGGHGGDCCQEKSECPITEKLMKKAHFFLDNQKEIGLKEDQVTAIKAIKMETKKAHIRQGAEMKVFKLDLKTKLSEPQLDTEGLNGMIDEMAAGMASGAKASIASYAKLKGILTAEQQAKAKEIWMQNEGSSKHSH